MESAPNRNLWQCDVCNVTEAENTRYKCLICKDYDLCSTCFDYELISLNHLRGHPMIRIDNCDNIFGDNYNSLDNMDLEILKLVYKDSVHKQQCNGCLIQNIIGLLFKCKNCPKTNLCYNCYLSKKESQDHNTNHPMIVIGT